MTRSIKSEQLKTFMDVKNFKSMYSYPLQITDQLQHEP